MKQPGAADPHDLPARPMNRQLFLVHRLGLSNRIYCILVLAACTVGKICTSPGQTPVIGLTIDHVISDVGLSRSASTWLYFVATTLSASTLPIVGRALDRFGPCAVASSVVVGLCCACVVYSFAVSQASLLIGFYLLRFFGQGSLMLVSQHRINLVFVRLRGRAMGIGGAFASLGMMGVVPPIVRTLESELGWRGTYRVLALVLAGGMLPLAAGFWREAPEFYGLLPDGDDRQGGADVSVGKKGKAAATEVSWSARDALRTSSFWSVAFGIGLIGLTATGFWFHWVAVAKEFGVPADAIVAAYPASAVASVAFRLLGGWIIDLYPPRVILAASLVLQSSGLGLTLLLERTPEAGVAIIIACLLGASGALMANVSGVAFAQFFGRENLGTISSVANAMIVFGSAIGPLPFAVSQDRLGSFRPAFIGATVAPIVAAIIVWYFGRRPVFRDHASTAVFQGGFTLSDPTDGRSSFRNWRSRGWSKGSYAAVVSDEDEFELELGAEPELSDGDEEDHS